MDATQNNFSGGMVSLFDATKTPPNSYRTGLNCRVRENALVGAFKPVRISTPNVIHQAICAFDDKLLAVLGGNIYKLDGASMVLVNTPSLSATADTIWHELVPAPTNFFMKQGAATETYNSVVSSYPEAAIFQDGVSVPVLVNSNLTARRAQTYAEWEFTRPEYVPIGKQMASSGNKLYIASPDGKRIFQSVSGRQLDFVLNIDNDGNKQGDADTTYLAVSAATLSALIPAQGSGFLAFTQYQSYSGLPDGNFPEIFGEPYIRPDNLFPVGAVSQSSFTFSNGESVFVTSAGIQLFNQVMQQQRQSNNSQFGAAILPLLNRPLTRVACCTVDDYVFFGVSTIYGDGILVYDNLINAFVSIDLVGSVKEFALLRVPGSTRVFFITTSNELFEMPLYAGERSTFAVYIGEYSSQLPDTQLKPEAIRCELTNLQSDGCVTVRTHTDKKVSTVNIVQLYATTPADNNLSVAPTLFTVAEATQNATVTAHLTDTAFGYAIGVEISCSANARLVSIKSDFSEQTVARPVAAANTQVDLTDERFLVLGNIRADSEVIGECSAETVIGRTYIIYAPIEDVRMQNGNRVFTVLEGKAKRFTAASDRVFYTASGYLYDYTSNSTLLERATFATPNDAAKRAVIITGNLGGTPHPVPWAMFSESGAELVGVAGVDEYNSIARLKDYLSRTARPAYSIFETTFVDFYCINVNPADAVHTAETGVIARWLEVTIATRDNGKFNVVVIGSPPFSNTTSFTPGVTALQWNFRRMGVHMVLSTAGAYERFVYNNVYYVNVGTGRATGLETTTAGLAIQGVLQLSAMPTILAGDFYDTAGKIRDRIAIVS